MTTRSRLVGWGSKAISIGVNPQDDPNTRLRKQLMFGFTYLIIPAGILWGTIYLAFDERLAAMLPYAYSLLSAISIFVFRYNRDYPAFRFRQWLFILLFPFLVMLSLGGFQQSSAVILWAFMCPLSVLMFHEPRQALPWVAAYFISIVVGAILAPVFRTTNHLPPALVSVFFVMNISAVTAVTLAVLASFVSQKDELMKQLSLEQQKSDSLLLNILPKEIAAILKYTPRTIAQHFDEATVMFADMVGFTQLTAELPPVEMVELLNEVFSKFDLLVDQYGLEKIRTIGDSYMVVSGVPRPRHDHAQAIAHMALDMQAYLVAHPPIGGERLNFRIGINSGPLIAGVIGRKKFIYDLWGDSVNTASRMESHSTPGKIQISQETYELIRDEFICELRGPVQVKGKGEMTTYFLLGRHDDPAVHWGMQTRLTG